MSRILCIKCESVSICNSLIFFSSNILANKQIQIPDYVAPSLPKNGVRAPLHSKGRQTEAEHRTMLWYLTSRDICRPARQDVILTIYGQKPLTGISLKITSLCMYDDSTEQPFWIWYFRLYALTRMKCQYVFLLVYHDKARYLFLF